MLTNTRSQTIARIADRTASQHQSTFGGHVTSSVTWPLIWHLIYHYMVVL